jgi:hypothetical protein
MMDSSNYKQPTLGLLLWGLTEGNPGFCSLLSFGYGVTPFHNKFFIIENIFVPLLCSRAGLTGL